MGGAREINFFGGPCMSQFVLNNKSKQATGGGLCVALSFRRKGREVTKYSQLPALLLAMTSAWIAMFTLGW